MTVHRCRKDTRRQKEKARLLRVSIEREKNRKNGSVVPLLHGRKMEAARSRWRRSVGSLDTVGEMAVSGAAWQTAGSVGLVGGMIASRSAATRCPGRSLGRVRSVGAALPLVDALLAVARLVRAATVRIRRGGGRRRAGVGVGIAVLLLSRPHPDFRIVTDHVMPRRL